MLYYSRKFVRTIETFQQLKHLFVVLHGIGFWSFVPLWSKFLDLCTKLRNTLCSSELHTGQNAISAGSDPIPAADGRRGYKDGRRQSTSSHSLHRLRTVIDDTGITLLGWPSRGGLIALSHAKAYHFNFLDIPHTNLPTERAATPDLEDQFCQYLLLLGATWFDSQERWRLRNALVLHDEEAEARIAYEEVAPLTATERLRVEVAWEDQSTAPDCGFWVVERDIMLENAEVLDDLARLEVATSMSERCEILENFEGISYYTCIQEYDGKRCLRAWKKNWKGELGPLEQTWLREDSRTWATWDRV